MPQPNQLRNYFTCLPLHIKKSNNILKFCKGAKTWLTNVSGISILSQAILWIFCYILSKQTRLWMLCWMHNQSYAYNAVDTFVLDCLWVDLDILFMCLFYDCHKHCEELHNHLVSITGLVTSSSLFIGLINNYFSFVLTQKLVMVREFNAFLFS